MSQTHIVKKYTNKSHERFAKTNKSWLFKSASCKLTIERYGHQDKSPHRSTKNRNTVLR